MLKSLDERQRVFRLAKKIKLVEFIFVSAMLVYAILMIYNRVACAPTNQECFVEVVQNQTTLRLIQLGMVVGSILTAWLVRLNFELFDEDPRSDKFFKVSVFGISLGYILSAYFLPTLANYGGMGPGQLPFVLILGIFFVYSILLLRNKHSWEQSSWFIKIRLSYYIVGQIIILVLPMLALIMGAITVFPLILIPFTPKEFKISQ